MHCLFQAGSLLKQLFKKRVAGRQVIGASQRSPPVNPDFPTVSLIASAETPGEGEMRLIGGVDTGATTSLLRESTARRLGLRIGPPRVRLFDVEGRPLSVKGEALVKVRLASPGSNSRSVVIPVAVVERMDLDVDVLLGATAAS